MWVVLNLIFLYVSSLPSKIPTYLGIYPELARIYAIYFLTSTLATGIELKRKHGQLLIVFRYLSRQWKRAVHPNLGPLVTVVVRALYPVSKLPKKCREYQKGFILTSRIL